MTNEARGKVDPYWLVNARASYTVGRAKISAFVTNLFDEKTPVLLTPGTTPDDVASMTRPRAAGVGVELCF